MLKVFQSLKTPKTKTQIAIELTQDTIEQYRMERMLLGVDAPESDKGMELLRRLAALMKGPHGQAVRPVVYQAFPELEPPQGHA